MWSIRLIVLAAVGVGIANVMAPSGAAEAPATEKAPATAAAHRKHSGPVGAAMRGLAEGASDVVVAEVLETNPRAAIEGGRDTVNLKVVESLMGETAAGDKIGVYYHLLWTEPYKEVEPPKFEKGKRYLVFLNHPGGKEFELADQWLSVMPGQGDRVAEAEAAIREAHGDARGSWSQNNDGINGRLVIYRREAFNGTPVLSVYMEVRGGWMMEIDLSKAKFTWEVRDEKGKVKDAGAKVSDWPENLRDQRVVLESRAKMRLPISNTPMRPDDEPLAKDQAGYMCVMPGKAWIFAPGDKGKYSLSGKMEIPPDGVAKHWHGVIDFGEVRVPVE